MTKLMQWLAAIGLFMSIWLAIVLDMIALNIPDSKKEIVYAVSTLVQLTALRPPFFSYSANITGESECSKLNHKYLWYL